MCTSFGTRTSPALPHNPVCLSHVTTNWQAHSFILPIGHAKDYKCGIPDKVLSTDFRIRTGRSASAYAYIDFICWLLSGKRAGASLNQEQQLAPRPPCLPLKT